MAYNPLKGDAQEKKDEKGSFEELILEFLECCGGATD